MKIRIVVSRINKADGIDIGLKADWESREMRFLFVNFKIKNGSQMV